MEKLVKLHTLIGKQKTPLTPEEIATHPKGWYAYFVRTYATREQLQDIFAYCSKFAWITHDKDTDENGEAKACHSHFIVRYSEKQTITAFAKKLHRLAPEEASHITPLGDKYCAIDYMLHRDAKSVEKGKHLYKESDIFTDDIGYFFRTKEETKASHKNEEFFADLLGGECSRREMALKYGRDYAKNYHHYDRFRDEVLREEYKPTVAPDDLARLESTALDIAGIVWQLLQKYAPKIKAGCNIPSYQYIRYDVDKIITEERIGI